MDRSSAVAYLNFSNFLRNPGSWEECKVYGLVSCSVHKNLLALARLQSFLVEQNMVLYIVNDLPLQGLCFRRISHIPSLSVFQMLLTLGTAWSI